MNRRPSLHYAWVVAVVTFFVLLVTAGIRATPGVLMVPLESWTFAAGFQARRLQSSSLFRGERRFAIAQSRNHHLEGRFERVSLFCQYTFG